jgi:hypothetical protein
VVWQGIEEFGGATMKVGRARNWTASVGPDRTITASHLAGHRVVFRFSANAPNEIEILGRVWFNDRPHDDDMQDATTAARAAARENGWLD